MSIKVANSRFIVSSLKKRLEFYQQIHSKVSDFHKLGEWLIAQAEELQACRYIEQLEAIGEVLCNLPIKDYELIGQYYLGWCAYRRGKDARATFENVIENSATHRSSALIDLATLELNAGNCNLGIKFCTEAIRQSNTVSIKANAARSIAVIKSAEGLHTSALKDLEAIAPLIRYTSPIARYQYFNSLTVEYGDVGRIGEAQNVCKIVLASPYAFAYPEWRETEQDLALRGYKSRSSVRIIQTFPGNVAYLSEHQREPSDTSIHPNIFGPAPVRSLQKWKEEKMVKEPNGDDLPPDANEKDLYLKIMEMIAQKDLSISELRQVIAFVEKLSSKSKS